jgi:hypothetical protein
MTTDIRFDSISLNSYTERCFRTKFLEQIRAHILCSVIIHENRAQLWDNMGKCGTARQATDGDMAHAPCMLDN